MPSWTRHRIRMTYAEEEVPGDFRDEGLSIRLVQAQASMTSLESFLVAIRPRIALEVRRLAGRGIDQAEVVQDALVNLFLAVPAYAPRSAVAEEADRAAAGWIARIVRTSLYGQAARERRWSRGRIATEELPEEAATLLSVMEPGDPHAVGSGLHRALDGLPEATRAVVQLRCLQGLDHAEIAQRLQITEENCRVRLFRGLARLRERLGPDERLPMG